mmetsp:Transcript_61002/g.150135  ORF Transcript_61002/g.150135 Transcript_61002/m.150135 type:complete len:94 (-) Transcript_61002:59-340(-)
MLDEMGYLQTPPAVISKDNASTVYSSNPDRPMRLRRRHIDTRIHRLSDLVRDKVLQLVKIATGTQLSDGLSKALAEDGVTRIRHLVRFGHGRR